MRGQRGQASVEWIVLVLLLALGLAALARLAPRADAGGLGAELVHGFTCAARGGCEAQPGARPPGGAAARGAPVRGGAPSRLVTVPPLVPVPPRAWGLAPRRLPWARPPAPGSPRARSGRPWLRPPRFAGPLVRRAGRGAGLLWRRSWMLCLGYERVRYSVLHPEIRFPHQTIPLSEDLRIANDCLSPVDLFRDFGRHGGPG
jgi:hypothetical protein